MTIILRILIILFSVLMVIAFSSIGALIMYLTEEEKFTDNDKTNEDIEVQMDTRKV